MGWLADVCRILFERSNEVIKVEIANENVAYFTLKCLKLFQGYITLREVTDYCINRLFQLNCLLVI